MGEKERDKAVWRLHGDHMLVGAERFLNSLCGGFGSRTDVAVSMLDLAHLNDLYNPCFPLQENLQPTSMLFSKF